MVQKFTKRKISLLMSIPSVIIVIVLLLQFFIFPSVTVKSVPFIDFYAEVPYGYDLFVYSEQLSNKTHFPPFIWIGESSTIHRTFREGQSVNMVYVKKNHRFEFERNYVLSGQIKRDILPVFKVSKDLWEWGQYSFFLDKTGKRYGEEYSNPYRFNIAIPTYPEGLKIDRVGVPYTAILLEAETYKIVIVVNVTSDVVKQFKVLFAEHDLKANRTVVTVKYNNGSFSFSEKGSSVLRGLTVGKPVWVRVVTVKTESSVVVDGKTVFSYVSKEESKYSIWDGSR